MTDINADVTAAIESAKADEAGGSTTPEVEEKVEETPASTTPEGKGDEGGKGKSAADEEEEFFNPTAEELDEIQKSPALQKVYKSMQRGFTKRTTELKSLRTEAQEALKVAEFIQANPLQAARNLAKATGLTIAEAKEVVADASGGKQTTAGQIKAVAEGLEERWSKTVSPEAAKVLRPLFEETAKTIVEQMVGPLVQRIDQAAERTDSLENAAATRSIGAAVKGFGATVIEAGNEWDDDIQGEMAELMNKVQPAENTSIEDFLESLYTQVMYNRSKATTQRQRLERLKRIKATSEPTSTARAGEARGKKEITADMSDKDAIALAVQAATEEASRGGR